MTIQRRNNLKYRLASQLAELRGREAQADLLEVEPDAHPTDLHRAHEDMAAPVFNTAMRRMGVPELRARIAGERLPLQTRAPRQSEMRR